MTSPAPAPVERLVAALEPFAKEADAWDGTPGLVRYDDTLELWQTRQTKVCVGDLRRAREALRAYQAQSAVPAPGGEFVLVPKEPNQVQWNKISSCIRQAQTQRDVEIIYRDLLSEIAITPDAYLCNVGEVNAGLIDNLGTYQALVTVKLSGDLTFTDEQIDAGVSAWFGGITAPHIVEPHRVNLRAALAALRTAVPPAPAASGWRTMESAPRDGTPILLGRDTGEPWGFVRGWGRWFDHGGVSGWVCQGAFSDPPGVLGLGHPTVWAPLPSPPDTAQGEG